MTVYLSEHICDSARKKLEAAATIVDNFDHPEEIDGLILLGAYLYGDYPPADTLTVYGSLNQSVEDKIDYTENVVEIEGGNHAQFGNYGPQKGDLPAAISAEEQQAQALAAISDFIARRQS